MGTTLDALRHLQEVERKLGDFRREEEAKRRQVQACQKQLQKCDQELENQRNEVRHHQAEIHNLELEVNSREQTIQKHRVALNRVKTNKEYAAILTSINTEKADTSKLENRVLALMNAKDTLQTSHDQLATQRDKLQERVNQAEAKLEAYLEKTGGQCGGLTREREQAGEALPPTVMDTFERAAERHDGEALAAVLKVNPKRDEYVCGGCNMAITLEMVNSLRTRDAVVVCHICGRILCFQE
ncbi:MAG: C4-type zinc ribbon domain-containing protein [Planctomycetota bacterium]